MTFDCTLIHKVLNGLCVHRILLILVSKSHVTISPVFIISNFLSASLYSSYEPY